ncbi:putative permease, YjgP/YjgQ family [Sulfurihydrogenibium azorense Az-Fu1]|uniref:Putative permease, YjgP/YjgQ family n=1 Tax=Sulfurihydrogenibium azorense (strain DSM 15241 / OCM 825 / Az-Fu1) TaxID=204536 RepID=C1DXQ5_SULAA|nr:LptF/LptG family permease [Sulfurihydrogenibium azorense]ACN99137.1 putative permease, YjgP/YjgQ family [Sulfurihydrogenibium azorense Az-Fu1]
MKILHRYILKNFFKKFIILIGLFSIVITSSQLLHLPNFAYSMNLIDFLQLLVMIDISFLKYQILFGFFIAWLLVGVSIRENNEIYAVYSLGVSQKELLKPVFITTTLFTALALIVSITLIPYANQERSKFLTLKVKNYILESIQPKNFSKINENISVYTESKENSTLHKIIIYNKSNKYLITAKEGIFFQDKVVLKDGYIHIPSEKSFSVIKYEKYSFSLDTSYVKEIPLEDYKTSQLINVFFSKEKDYQKAYSVLIDRIFFPIPFIFIGFIGFLLGLNFSKSKETLLSLVISISILYMVINYLFIRVIEKNTFISFVYLLVLILLFSGILRFVWKKSE